MIKPHLAVTIIPEIGCILVFNVEQNLWLVRVGLWVIIWQCMVYFLTLWTA